MPRPLLTLTLIAAILMPAAAAQAKAPAVAHRHATTLHGAVGREASNDPVVVATAIAERYWGAVPCAGKLTVRATQALPASLDPTTDGWTTFESSLGPNDLEAPAASYTQCAISLARWQWPNRTEMEVDWNMFCLTVVHEMGHLLGHPHSLTPGSVMAPVFVDETSVPAICRKQHVAMLALAEAPAAATAGR